jgi:hypothetical protein
MGSDRGPSIDTAELSKLRRPLERIRAEIRAHIAKWPGSIRHAFRATVGPAKDESELPVWAEFEVWFFYANEGFRGPLALRFAPRPKMKRGPWSCIFTDSCNEMEMWREFDCIIGNLDGLLAGERFRRAWQSNDGLGWLLFLYFLKWDFPDELVYRLCGASFTLEGIPIGEVSSAPDPFRSRNAFESWERGAKRGLPVGQHFIGLRSDIRQCSREAIDELLVLGSDAQQASAPAGRVRANVVKLFPKGEPRNRDLVELALKINTEKDTGKSLNQIAAEYTCNSRRAKSLLASLRRMKRQGEVNL